MTAKENNKMAAGFHGDAVDMLAAGFGCLLLLRNTQNEIEDYMFLYN
jgi:hypothetical protein